MKTLKNYDHFSKEYRANESAKINENVFSDIFNKVISFFKNHFGKHAWIYYALYLQKKGKLPKGIELICPPTYASTSDLPSNKEIEESGLENEVEPVEDEKEKEIPGLKGSDETPVNNEEEKVVNDEIEELEKVKESLKNLYLNEGFLDDGDEFISLDHPESEVLNEDVAELKYEIKELYRSNTLRASRHSAEGKGTKYARKKTNALFIWGAPGIGKTEILHQVAKELDIAVIEWHLSQIEPTDFRGIPKIENVVKGSDDSKDERTVWKLPVIFPTSNGDNGKGGIMFFDELNRAPQMVLDASLSLALSGKHGTYELPSLWIVIAAGNRGSDLAAGGLTDDKILWNRFQHINFSPRPSDWLGYVSNIASVNPKLIQFIKENPEYYHRLHSVNQEPNWASPRAWEMASEDDYFERGFDWKNKLSYNEVLEIYEDFVGYKNAVAFVKFITKLDEKERSEEIKKNSEGKIRRGESPDDNVIKNKNKK